jgi:acyl-CoA thioester hydrolase
MIASLDAYFHRLEFAVRDYECDLQGIVNNANYQHYLEHARHECLKTHMGLNFAALSQQGINLVVVRVEIDYRSPLRSGDAFVVCSNLERVSRLRFAFVQDIFKLPSLSPIINARVIGTAIDARGRPTLPAEIEAMLAQFAKPMQEPNS